MYETKLSFEMKWRKTKSKKPTPKTVQLTIKGGL